MKQYLLLRLKAPLMSFGDTDASEERGPTMRHPGKSMITGLIANALGYDHSDPAATQRLQDGIEIASLELKRGRIVVDDQASRLAVQDTAWTTSGTPLKRGGHPYSYEHALRRQKEYIADGDFIVAVAAEPELLAEIAQAVRQPARPLFIGRRCCLPSRSLYHGLIEAQNLTQALASAGTGHARWPQGESHAPAPTKQLAIADLRDWISRLHCGRRLVVEGTI